MVKEQRLAVKEQQLAVKELDQRLAVKRSINGTITEKSSYQQMVKFFELNPTIRLFDIDPNDEILCITSLRSWLPHTLPLEKIELLLEKGANPNSHGFSQSKCTPLYFIVHNNHCTHPDTLKIIKVLIKHGGIFKNEYLESILCCHKIVTDIFEFCLNHCIEYNQNPNFNILLDIINKRIREYTRYNNNNDNDLYEKEICELIIMEQMVKEKIKQKEQTEIKLLFESKMNSAIKLIGLLQSVIPIYNNIITNGQNASNLLNLAESYDKINKLYLNL